MGGSAGNSNAQLLSLIAQYGDKGGGGGGSNGGAPAGPKMSMKQQMQASLDSWVKNSLNGGFQGIPGFFPAGGGGMGGNGGGGNKPKPTTPPAQTVGIDWKFPQYTQQWAFTPPTPSPYMNPPPFDPNTYLKGKKKT